MLCEPEIETGNSELVFKNLILNYVVDENNAVWKHSYAPYCKAGICAEYRDVQDKVPCNAKPPSKDYQRVCYCKEKCKSLYCCCYKKLFTFQTF